MYYLFVPLEYEYVGAFTLFQFHCKRTMLHKMPIRILHDHGYLMSMVLAYNAHLQRISTWTLECQVQFADIMDNDNDQVN